MVSGLMLSHVPPDACLREKTKCFSAALEGGVCVSISDGDKFEFFSVNICTPKPTSRHRLSQAQRY